jgi:hypothetical protein
MQVQKLIFLKCNTDLQELYAKNVEIIFNIFTLGMWLIWDEESGVYRVLVGKPE